VKVLLRFVSAALAATSATIPLTPLTPSIVQTEIRALGAKPVVDQLFKTETWWQVTGYIGAGKPDWIALAPDLAEGTDAATSETLSISLSEALPKSPDEVLTVLELGGDASPLFVGKVCSAPFLEDTSSHQHLYKAAALHALSAVADPRLSNLKAACVDQLAKIP
jgi:hypothetical protein